MDEQKGMAYSIPARITQGVYLSINQSINDIRVHHATQALGQNVVQSST